MYARTGLWRTGLWAAGLGLAVAIATGPAGAQTPKRGGTLTYVIPADAPPSFDGHRETTYATVHAAAPYSGATVKGSALGGGTLFGSRMFASC